ncbi:restriction endonuclease subunit S [Reinekea forsetii]|uniref:Type I restriction-modification system, specificity subunit S n=1 Tax=Reinekea forsetii TaxID=1336806 RepID=A0A2K8KQP8_9GAMM|nr:restriction endonuclease subunit S [Reinekea forsetii]ATX77065.1 type I restriction-modification system, specificity subunit S [Reinekea forsetii]
MEQALYELPDGWEWHKLVNLTTKIGSGATPKGGEKAYKESGISLIRSLNVHDCRFKFKRLAFIDDDQAYALKNVVVKTGDILLNITGASIARSCIVPDEYLPARVNQHVAILRVKENIDNGFLNYLVVSPKFKANLLWQGAGGATRQALTKTMIEQLDIPLPLISEQKRIVEKLDALITLIDTAIEHLQESVKLADALYASQLSNVFSLGHEQWPSMELHQVAKVARGKSKHRPRNDKSLFGGDYPFIQTGDVRNAQKYISAYSATYSEKGLQQSKLWAKGTICLTIAANIGDVAILDMDACFPDSVVGISSSELSTEYLYYFLTTLQQYLDTQANAAAQKNINLKILSRIKLSVPTTEEQKVIVEKIKAMDTLSIELKKELNEKIQYLSELKESILNSAFKGEL